MKSLCFECALPATEKAHVVPRSRGGTKTIPLCGTCHGLSHSMDRPQDIGTLTKEGLAKAKQRGVVLGRPKILCSILRTQIRDSHRQGMSFNSIARTLNVSGVLSATGGKWYASTIRSVVKSAGVSVNNL